MGKNGKKNGVEWDGTDKTEWGGNGTFFNAYCTCVNVCISKSMGVTVASNFCVHTVGVKKTLRSRSVSIPFSFTGNERAEKMTCCFARSVPPVLPSNPSTCTRSNESC